MIFGFRVVISIGLCLILLLRVLVFIVKFLMVFFVSIDEVLFSSFIMFRRFVLISGSMILSWKLLDWFVIVMV